MNTKAIIALLVALFSAVSGVLNTDLQKDSVKKPFLNKNGSFEMDGAYYYALMPIVNYGSELNEIGFVPGTECEDIGPEDFLVIDNEVAILDSANRRIMIYGTGKMLRSIEMDYSGYPRLFADFRDNLYVFDSALDRVFVIDYSTGCLLEKIALASDISSGCVWEMSSDEESVYLWTDTYQLHDILRGGVKYPISVRTENGSIIWSTPFSEKEATVEGVTVCFLSYDESGNSYFLMYEEVPDTPVILDEVTLRCFSPDGELLGVARIPEEDSIFHPCSNTYITPDGNAFVMLCGEQGVMVFEVQLVETYVSHMDELELRARIIEKEHRECLARYSQLHCEKPLEQLSLGE